VTDDGEGIPREALDRIFDPFFTTKDDGKGVGLGLAVVYGIVESHGGRIEVRTAEGGGTTVEVTLPLAPDGGPTPPGPEHAVRRTERADCGSGPEPRAFGGGGAARCLRASRRRGRDRRAPPAFSPARGQWSSVVFLEALLARVPPGVSRLLGVTERDLFVPVLSFVYGQAQLGGKVAVVSRRASARVPCLPDRPRPARRAAAEAVHEVGHTFGLVHCPDRRCPMSLSIDLPDLDGKTATPCPPAGLLEGSREMRRTRARTEGVRS
jgi:archaemetzincin